jgi:hypothetical protein
MSVKWARDPSLTKCLFVVVPFLLQVEVRSPGFYPINRGVALLSGSDRDMDVSMIPLCYLLEVAG